MFRLDNALSDTGLGIGPENVELKLAYLDAPFDCSIPDGRVMMTWAWATCRTAGSAPSAPDGPRGLRPGQRRHRHQGTGDADYGKICGICFLTSSPRGGVLRYANVDACTTNSANCRRSGLPHRLAVERVHHRRLHQGGPL